ncbi:MAG: DUF5689 domain-containing protein [Leeuwenhoekiella sp.]
MRKFYFLLLSMLITVGLNAQDLIITGVVDGDLTGGLPKVIELYVVNDIADLSSYGFGSANNGGGTDGVEFQLSGSASAGDYLYIGSEVDGFTTFFGFAPTFDAGQAAEINGDDAVELFGNVVNNAGTLEGTVIDSFGEPDTNGDGEPWDYTDGWAYRVNGTGPDGNTFVVSNFTYSGLGGLDGESTNAAAAKPFPVGSYSTEASTTPELTIVSPSEGDELLPFTTSTDLTFGVMNVDFDMDGNQVDATVNGTKFTDVSSPLTIDVMDGDNAVLLELLVANTVVASKSATFSVPVPTEVADIAALRAGNTGDIYTLTGEAFLTYIQSFRGQKYFEDSTGAVLIDDNDDTLNSDFEIGDGITGLTGRLNEFGGTIQFDPLIDVTASSVGNTITAQTVTLAELTANPEDYESELIIVKNVTFADNTGTFSTSSTDDANTDAITDATGSFTFRTSFFSADYVGGEVPDGETDIRGIINERSGNEYFLTARNLADFGDNLSVGDAKIGVQLYPNPVTGGKVYFAQPQSYSLFDIQGRKVAEDQEARTIDVSAMASGTYILKTVSGATEKLLLQ